MTLFLLLSCSLKKQYKSAGEHTEAGTVSGHLSPPSPSGEASPGVLLSNCWQLLEELQYELLVCGV